MGPLVTLLISVLGVFVFIVEANQKGPHRLLKPMDGVHLRVAVYHEPPIFSIIKDPTNDSIVQYSGFPKAFFDILSASLGFRYSFVEVTPTMVKSIGSIDTAINRELLQKNADINGRLISPTAERLSYMDFTVAVSVLQFALIQPTPKIHNRYLATVQPFQPVVWYLILVAFCATSMVLAFLIKVGRKMEPKNKREDSVLHVFSKSAWYAFDVLMAQGGVLPSHRLSFRLMSGTWCLIAVVIFYAYNSTLISYISLPKYEPIINTWEELAASKTLRLVTPRGGIFTKNILTATSGALKTLGDSLRKNPNDQLLTLPGIVDKVLASGCCAYFEVKRLGEVLVYRSMMENKGKCTLTLSQTWDYYQIWTFGVVKNLQYLPLIDKEIQRLRQIGLITRLGASFSRSIERCLTFNYGDNVGKRKLGLYELTSAFVILGFGWTVSFLAFTIEKLSEFQSRIIV